MPGGLNALFPEPSSNFILFLLIFYPLTCSIRQRLPVLDLPPCMVSCAPFATSSQVLYCAPTTYSRNFPRSRFANSFLPSDRAPPLTCFPPTPPPCAAFHPKDRILCLSFFRRPSLWDISPRCVTDGVFRWDKFIISHGRCCLFAGRLVFRGVSFSRPNWFSSASAFLFSWVTCTGVLGLGSQDLLAGARTLARRFRLPNPCLLALHTLNDGLYRLPEPLRRDVL